VHAYLSGTVLSGALRGGEFALAIALGAPIRGGRALGLVGGLRGTHHSARDSRVDVGLLAGAGIVGLQVLLLPGSTLRATLQVVLSS
jgi:hypothetical protein